MKDKEGNRFLIAICFVLVVGCAGLLVAGCATEPAGVPEPQEIVETQGHDLDGFPPPIPHDLEAKTDCLVCHREGELGKAPKTPHPELTTCRQCHVLEEI
ncbi:MAG: hypothetical protein GX262_04095 [Clostridia bacterium]|nr:hypothetical protein [Clostridia bacterium]